MAAALLRSSLGLALRRAATAPSSSSRLSSAMGGGANAGAARTYYGYGGRSQYDAQAYSQAGGFFPPSQMDKADGYFTAAAFVGALLFICLVGKEYRFWGARPPRHG